MTTTEQFDQTAPFGADASLAPVAALSATGKPLTKRGEATRRKLLEAAEEVFAGLGYH